MRKWMMVAKKRRKSERHPRGEVPNRPKQQTANKQEGADESFQD